MQDDVLEGGITVVAVGAPTAGSEVNLDVAGLGRLIAYLHNSATEIRTALDTAKTRMKDADRLAVQGCELIAEQSLVLPDRLQEAFGRGVPVLVEGGNHAGAHTPLGIKAGQDRRHLAIAFALIRRQSQALV